MKRTLQLLLIFIAIAWLSASCGHPNETEIIDDEIIDDPANDRTPVDQMSSGHLMSYHEVTDTLNQPDCGYTEGVWMTLMPGKETVYNPTSYSLLLVHIGHYSDGYRSTHGLSNETFDLDAAFFSGLRKTLKNARKNGVTVGIRLR